jgi:hypothetical protein
MRGKAALTITVAQMNCPSTNQSPSKLWPWQRVRGDPRSRLAMRRTPSGKYFCAAPVAFAVASFNAHPTGARKSGGTEASAHLSILLKIASACRPVTRLATTRSTPIIHCSGHASAAAEPSVCEMDIVLGASAGRAAARTRSHATAAARSSARRRSRPIIRGKPGSRSTSPSSPLSPHRYVTIGTLHVPQTRARSPV